MRAPRPALRPFVETLWLSDSGGSPAGPARELSLPTGAMHLAVRLSGPALRVYADEADRHGRSFGPAVVGGARARAYLRDISQPVRSLGAVLAPGAAQALFGVPATELSHQHSDLGDLWGTAADELNERLLFAPPAADPLAIFEELLTARVRARSVHPIVAHALSRLAPRGDVAAVVRETGYSQRRFLTLFSEEVGLSPKVFCRVQRLQAALTLTAAPSRSLAQVALAVGYSDQAHFNRDFKELTGLSPGRYRLLAPASPNHVPLPSR